MKRRNLLLVATVLGATAAFVRFSTADVKNSRRADSASTYEATDATADLDPSRPDVPANDCIAPACKITALPPSPHAILLTHAQWENTVRDLLRLPTSPGFSKSFPADPAPSGEDFGRDASNLVVATRALWQTHRDAAEALAKRVVDDPIAIDKLLPAAAKSGDTTARLRACVTDFLPRAYRRPVQDAEIDAMLALGESVAAADPQADTFLVRLRWILTAILQAPYFLYRVESGVADLEFAQQSVRSLDTAREKIAPPRDERNLPSHQQSPPFTPSSRPRLAAYRGAYPEVPGKTADPLEERHGVANATQRTAIDERVRLGDYELASKLSYALWGTMPDDKLMAYAQSKQLATKDGVAAVVKEMLADPRAAWALSGFHEQLFGVDKFGRIIRQTGEFPKFYPDLGRDAQEDIRRTIKDLVIDNPGTVKDLYSSDIAYVNANLARVYGLDPATIPGLDANPDAFVRVKMPDKRAGMLMHVGWLAMQAHPKDPSSIQRGVFMARRVLCLALGTPPAGALNTKIEGPPGANNRGRVEATTQSLRECKGCHGRVINPMGFAFEGFDSIGSFRTQDGDSVVDTTGTTELLGAFDGATAMLSTARDTPNAHACYAAHWSAYLNGKPKVQATSKWLSPIVDQSMKGAPVRDIVAALVQTDAFLTVSR